MKLNRQLGQYDVKTKLLDHLDSLNMIKKGNRPFPVSAEISLSNQCNHKCTFCQSNSIFKTSNSMLKKKIVINVLKDLKDLGIKGIVWSGGGEPMKHPDFYEVIEFSHKLGISNGLITNLSLLKQKEIKLLLETMAWIRISLNSGNKKNYKKIHGTNHFDKIINNIMILTKNNMKSIKKIPISISMVYTKENIDSFIDLIAKAIDLKVDSVHLRPDQFTKDISWVNSGVITEKLKYAEEIIKNKKSNLKISTSEYLKNQYLDKYPKKCYAHFFTLSISADGNLNFCKSRFNTSKTNCGNLYNTSIKEIWNSAKIKKLEKTIRPSECAGFCRQAHVNFHLDKIINIPKQLNTNFI